MLQVEKDKTETVGFTALISAIPEKGSNSKDLVLREVANTKDSTNYLLETHSSGVLNRKKADPAQAADAVKFIKQTMDQQLGAGTSDRIFQQTNLQGKSSINLGELRKLAGHYQQHMEQLQTELSNPGRETAQKWRQAAATVPPQAAQKPALNPLHELLTEADMNWSIAESGSGGALIGRRGDGSGVVIKIEDLDNVQKAAGLSAVLENGLPDVYEVARVRNETTTLGVRAGLRGKLDDLLSNAATSEKAQKKIQTHLDHIEKAAIGISSMEMVPGTQLNKLPLDDKIALLQSGQLAREIGKAAVLCPAAGLSDHASPSSDHNLLPTNLSNFLVNENTGQLNPIDFDAREMDNGKFGVRNTHLGVQEMARLATFATASQENFDRVMQGMAADFKQGGGQRTALGGPLGALATNSSSEGLFNSPERDVAAPLMTDELIKTQAVNMLQGMIGGMELLHQNAQHLQQAVNVSREIGSSEETQQALERLNNLDFHALRQNVASLAAGQGLAVEPNIQISQPSSGSNSLSAGNDVSSSSHAVGNGSGLIPSQNVAASKSRRTAIRFESGQLPEIIPDDIQAMNDSAELPLSSLDFGVKESELGEMSVVDLQSELQRLNTQFADSPQRQVLVTAVSQALDAKLESEAVKVTQPAHSNQGSVGANWNKQSATRPARAANFQMGAKPTSTVQDSLSIGGSSSSNSLPQSTLKPTPPPRPVRTTPVSTTVSNMPIKTGNTNKIKDQLFGHLEPAPPEDHTKKQIVAPRKPGLGGGGV